MEHLLKVHSHRMQCGATPRCTARHRFRAKKSKARTHLSWNLMLGCLQLLLQFLNKQMQIVKLFLRLKNANSLTGEWCQKQYQRTVMLFADVTTSCGNSYPQRSVRIIYVISSHENWTELNWTGSAFQFTAAQIRWNVWCERSFIFLSVPSGHPLLPICAFLALTCPLISTHFVFQHQWSRTFSPSRYSFIPSHGFIPKVSKPICFNVLLEPKWQAKRHWFIYI